MVKTAAKAEATKKLPNSSMLEETKTPSKPRKKDEFLNAAGKSGTQLIDGIINEEYNADLSGQSGIEKFEMMRKSDAQVFATLLAMELPIRSTAWKVLPATNEDGEVDDAAREVQRFVQKNLFEKMSSTWNQFLQEVLTMLPFGFSIFEKVYGIDAEGMIFLKKLGFRKQNTILKRQQEDGTAGIQQALPEATFEGPQKGQQTVNIPASKLLVFSFRREGDNYAGTSVLRSAYKHRYIKDKLYRYDAIKHERQAVGIPVIYGPTDMDDDDLAEAQRIVGNIRSNESTGVVMPGSKEDGWLLEFADMKAKSGSDLFESIKHHNREIAKNILAQFLELGDTASGSRSLSEDQSDLFLLSLTAVAQQIEDVVNRFLIPELVDLNFDVEDYPKIQFAKLGDTDYQKFATMLATLTGAALLTPDENIEDFIREEVGLPARIKDEMKDGEDGEIEDEGDDGSDDDTPDDDGGLDSLAKELESLTANEDEGDEFNDLIDELSEAMFSHLENSEEFVAKGGHLTQEHKDAISEALKKKGGKDLLDKKEKVTARVKKRTDSIEKTSAEFKKATASIRKDIDALKSQKDSIPKGKAGTAQRKAFAAKVKVLVAQIKNLRDGRDAKINPLKELRSKDIQTRKQVNQIIKERKSTIQAQIKVIREDLKQGRITLKDAIEPMKKDVKSNVLKMKELREDMKDLPKDDEKRLALKAMIDGLLQENTTNRETQSLLRSEYSTKADAGKKNIDKIKDDSELYHDMKQDGCACDFHSKDELFLDEEYLSMSSMFNNSFIIKLQNECSDAESYAKLKNKGFKFNEYEKESPRPLTFAEKKVNFTSLKRAMDTFNATLEESVNNITSQQKADLLEQIKKAVESNDIAAVGQIKAKRTGELSQALTDVQKELFEIGKKTAATEMNVKVPPTKAEVRGAMRVQNDAVINGIVGNIETAAKTAVSEAIAKRAGSITATSSTEAIAAASQNLDKVFEKAKATLNTLGITGAVNLGRASIFERYPEKIYGFQYSAILDDRTTETCRSLDGRVVKAGSQEFYDYAPPRHYRCRSIRVEILMEETFKPKFTGIPSGITANVTIDTFKDLKAPIVLKNSPAIKIIQQEIDERKTKLEELMKSGQFPNRQEQHKARITELENSLAKAEKSAFNEYVRNILKSDGIDLKMMVE